MKTKNIFFKHSVTFFSTFLNIHITTYHNSKENQRPFKTKH